MAEKVLVAMSGGVDSAASAILLKEQGYDVVGVNLRLWEYEKNVKDCNIEVKSKSCCSPEDIQDAGFVAQRIGIPFYVIKMEDQFREKVIDNFIGEYQSARTPNPCVNCNTFVKFGELWSKARALGISKIATGHYARIKEKDGRYSIEAGLDAEKNQAYYLYGLSQEALAATIFPLGEMSKPEARAVAARYNLSIASKAESQDICFIPDNDYRRFLKSQGVQFKPGRFLDLEGNVVGEHDGKEKYTIGQRRGLGISHSEPLYVKEIRAGGDIVVAPAEALGESEFFVTDPNFMMLDPENLSPEKEHFGLVQIRSRHTPVECRFTIEELNGNTVARVKTLAPEPGITPGQSAVIYEAVAKNEAVGGNALQAVHTAGAVLLGGLIAKEKRNI